MDIHATLSSLEHPKVHPIVSPHPGSSFLSKPLVAPPAWCEDCIIEHIIALFCVLALLFCTDVLWTDVLHIMNTKAAVASADACCAIRSLQFSALASQSVKCCCSSSDFRVPSSALVADPTVVLVLALLTKLRAHSSPQLTCRWRQVRCCASLRGENHRSVPGVKWTTVSAFSGNCIGGLTKGCLLLSWTSEILRTQEQPEQMVAGPKEMLATPGCSNHVRLRVERVGLSGAGCAEVAREA